MGLSSLAVVLGIINQIYAIDFQTNALYQQKFAIAKFAQLMNQNKMSAYMAKEGQMVKFQVLDMSGDVPVIVQNRFRNSNSVLRAAAANNTAPGQPGHQIFQNHRAELFRSNGVNDTRRFRPDGTVESGEIRVGSVVVPATYAACTTEEQREAFRKVRHLEDVARARAQTQLGENYYYSQNANGVSNTDLFLGRGEVRDDSFLVYDASGHLTPPGFLPITDQSRAAWANASASDIFHPNVGSNAHAASDGEVEDVYRGVGGAPATPQARRDAFNRLAGLEDGAVLNAAGGAGNEFVALAAKYGLPANCTAQQLRQAITNGIRQNRRAQCPTAKKGELMLDKKQAEELAKAYLEALNQMEKEIDMKLETLKSQRAALNSQKEEYQKYVSEGIKSSFKNNYA